MTRFAIHRPSLCHMLTGVLTTALLAGCSTQAAPSASLSAGQAEAALARGKTERAVQHAEAAVRAEPRNAAYRAMLGDAYLESGRFTSASSSFSDAFALGDRSSRTALSYALALIGAGMHAEAANVLGAYEGQIGTSDLGLAFVLAGQPARGVQMLERGIRAGENTVKMRQNLAYSYALAGRWREARLMAAQDVPADQLDARIEEWSRIAHPQAWQQRVAALIDVPAGISDPGQPVQLALANNPSIDQLAAEALAAAPAPQTEPEAVALSTAPGLPAPAMQPAVAAAPLAVELPPLLAAAPVSVAPPAMVAPPAPAPQALAGQASFDAVFAERSAQGAAPSTASRDAVRASLAAPAEAPRPRAVAAATMAQGNHLVQLGSFSSEENARRAQQIFASRYPELEGRRMVITQAVVQGKRFWRVSAGGFAAGESRALCGAIRSRGEGCFAYTEARPLPGAVNSGVMLARR